LKFNFRESSIGRRLLAWTQADKYDPSRESFADKYYPSRESFDQDKQKID
jgi:hypothetical protein